MLSNHNKNASSFRIIEPKQFQQAQQIPIPLAQQIPILSVNKHHNNSFTNGAILFNDNHTPASFNSHSMSHQHLYQNQQHQNQQYQLQQRTRNLSDTDSSCIPGKYSKKNI